MTYQLTRAAANAAPYSGRTAKIGKAYDALPAAVAHAMEYVRTKGDKVTVTCQRTGLWCSIGELHYANGPRAGTEHIELSMPPGWTEAMLSAFSARQATPANAAP